MQKVVAQPNINAKQYSSLKIPLPPVVLQQEFAKKVKKIELLKEKQNHTNIHVNNLLDSLTQDAFKGELIC